MPAVFLEQSVYLIFRITYKTNTQNPVQSFTILENSLQTFKIVKKSIIDLVDHKVLNDLENLSNPTSEHLSKWIWSKLILELPKLVKIKLSEDHGTGIVYQGE